MLNLITTAYADEVDLQKAYPFAQFSTDPNGNSSIGTVINNLFPTLFAILAAFILFIILFAGFKILNSGGDKTAVQDARNMITHSIIGLVLLMLLFIIMEFVLPLLGLSGLNIIKP